MAAGFAVTISATDRASGTFDAINKRMAAFNKEVARARAPFDQLSTNFAKLTKTTGLDKISGGMQEVARAGFSAFQSVSRIVEPLAAIARRRQRRRHGPARDRLGRLRERAGKHVGPRQPDQ